MLFGRHEDDPRADGSPKLLHRPHRIHIAGRRWRGDADRTFEQIRLGELDPALFAAGHRMAADEVNGVGKNLAGKLDDRSLGAADVGDDRPRLQSRRHLAEQFLKDSNRGTEHNAIRLTDGCQQVLGRFIDRPHLDGLAERHRPVSITDDKTILYELLGGKSKRSAQKSHTDDAQATYYHSPITGRVNTGCWKCQLHLNFP